MLQFLSLSRKRTCRYGPTSNTYICNRWKKSIVRRGGQSFFRVVGDTSIPSTVPFRPSTYRSFKTGRPRAFHTLRAHVCVSAWHWHWPQVKREAERDALRSPPPPHSCALFLHSICRFLLLCLQFHLFWWATPKNTIWRQSQFPFLLFLFPKSLLGFSENTIGIHKGVLTE